MKRRHAGTVQVAVAMLCLVGTACSEPAAAPAPMAADHDGADGGSLDRGDRREPGSAGGLVVTGAGGAEISVVRAPRDCVDAQCSTSRGETTPVVVADGRTAQVSSAELASHVAARTPDGEAVDVALDGAAELIVFAPGTLPGTYETVLVGAGGAVWIFDVTVR